MTKIVIFGNTVDRRSVSSQYYSAENPASR
jgi:hypothetical protein